MKASPRVGESFLALAKIDQRSAAADIECPVLIMSCSAGSILSFDGVAASCALYLETRLVEFSGCGHAPFLEDGGTCRTELLRFVDSFTAN